MKYVVVLVIAFISFQIFADPPASYPIPPETKNGLFYLQRSNNSNTVVYDANLQADGSLSKREPIDVYWLRYNTTGERKALNFAQRNFAYGYKSKKLGANRGYSISLMAYAERDIRVFIDDAGNPAAHIKINDGIAKLKNIYIDTSGSGFWSKVNYIELFGLDLKTGAAIKERFDPNEESSF